MDSECEEVLGVSYPTLFCLCAFLCMHENDMIKISKSEEPIQDKIQILNDERKWLMTFQHIHPDQSYSVPVLDKPHSTL